MLRNWAAVIAEIATSPPSCDRENTRTAQTTSIENRSSTPGGSDGATGNVDITTRGSTCRSTVASVYYNRGTRTVRTGQSATKDNTDGTRYRYSAGTGIEY